MSAEDKFLKESYLESLEAKEKVPFLPINLLPNRVSSVSLTRQLKWDVTIDTSMPSEEKHTPPACQIDTEEKISSSMSQ
ncbi:hypothetical protein J6590_002943 [Homalodisca vitripennis]|nr:hypothetical protein J6590_002943 [Homalodisca vitripennis]